MSATFMVRNLDFVLRKKPAGFSKRAQAVWVCERRQGDPWHVGHQVQVSEDGGLGVE